jgi:hypothetical protein
MHTKAQTVWVALLIETLKKSYCLFRHDSSSAFVSSWFRDWAPSKANTQEYVGHIIFRGTYPVHMVHILTLIHQS